MENVITTKPIRLNAERIGFLAIETVFMAAIAAFWKRPVSLDPLSLVVLAFAAFRMARMLSFNEVAELLRAPFTEVVKDSCGAGADVHPRGEGIQYVIGSLLSCPICTGTWSSLVLFSLWVLLPAFGKPLAYVLALAGAIELLHYGACALEWSGRLSRVQSGKIAPDKY